MVMECKCGRDLEGDSMRVRGTESGKRLWGKRVGGSTGGTDLGKGSVAHDGDSNFPMAAGARGAYHCIKAGNEEKETKKFRADVCFVVFLAWQNKARAMKN